MTPIITKTELEVRYAETDQMGVVHHSNYAIYFELARVDWLRKVGMHYHEMEKNGVMLPLSRLNLNFKKPAKFGDNLQVFTKLNQMPDVKIIFDYEIFNNEELITTGQTVLVFVDKTTMKPMRCPKSTLELISNFKR